MSLDEFFSIIGSFFSLLNGWKVIGSVSVLQIFLTCLVISIISKLLKGKKGE